MLRCTSSVVFCWSRSFSQINRLEVCNQGRNKDYGRKTTFHSTWNLGIWPSSWPNWGFVLLSYSILLITVVKPKTPSHSPWTYGSGYCRVSVKSLSCIKLLPFGHAKMGHLNAKGGCVSKRVLEMQCACMCIHRLSRKALNNILMHSILQQKVPFVHYHR